MRLSRRTLLKGAGACLCWPAIFGVPALRADRSGRARRAEIPPILFVHGNGDHAALWITTLWRMESNGVPRDRMFAINFTDPLARTDDTVAQPNRSSTEDQRRELGEAIKALKQRTGASRVALVGNSRGGNAIRNTSRTAARPMSATPCCAACPITASMPGTTISATSSTAAGRSCAASTRATAR